MGGFFCLKNPSVPWANDIELAFIPDAGFAGTNREVHSALRI